MIKKFNLSEIAVKKLKADSLKAGLSESVFIEALILNFKFCPVPSEDLLNALHDLCELANNTSGEDRESLIHLISDLEQKYFWRQTTNGSD